MDETWIAHDSNDTLSISPVSGSYHTSRLGSVASISLKQLYEEDEWRLANRFFGEGAAIFRPNGVLLDLGGRTGMFAIHYAHICPRWRVFVVEPNIKLYELIQKKVAGHSLSNISVHRTLREASDTIGAHSDSIDLVKVDKLAFDMGAVRQLLTCFRVDHICGEFDERQASALELFRVSARFASSFRWIMGPSLEVLSGYHYDCPEVSIIVPACNVEHYLPKCLESIVQQSLISKEILVVDDGSTDNTGRIADEWAEKHHQIRVIHKSNGGCASARSAGLAAANGLFVAFVDSDDWVEREMFESLFEAAVIAGADVAQCGFRKIYEEDGVSEPVYEFWPVEQTGMKVGLVPDSRDLLVSMPSIWRRIYSKEFLRSNEIDFAIHLKRFDDLPFQFEVLMRNPRLAVIPEIYYNYRLGRVGQDVSVRDQRMFIHFDIFDWLRSKCSEMGSARVERALKRVQINTHTWALEKLDPSLRIEYAVRAGRDIFTPSILTRRQILGVIGSLKLGQQLGLLWRLARGCLAKA